MAIGRAGGTSGRRCVLLVEDEYFIADDLHQAFAAAGAEVVGPVATVRDALAIVEKRPVDAAVVDINLQGELAFEVVDALLAKGIRTGFATGYASETIPPAFRRLPRWQKPFDPEEVARSLLVDD